ncbi:hypothetical protein QUB70_33100, partial [Microcoleus sp. A003_D6]
KSVLSSDIHSVAKQGVVTTEEIERMLSDASRELSSKPSGLKKLGIDEIALTLMSRKLLCRIKRFRNI